MVKKGQIIEVEGKRGEIVGVFPSRGLASLKHRGYISINVDGTYQSGSKVKLIKEVS